MSINMGRAVAYLELDTSKFTQGFRKAGNELKVFADKSATTEQKLNGVSNTMMAVGSTLTKSVTVPLVGVGALAVKTAADFESGMSEVKAISGATGEELKALENKAIEMGAKTKFSASDSAEAFKYMAMAGWDASAMMDGIAGVMDLAAASGEDLATTSDIVTDALTAFGLQAKDSAHFADVLAQASSKSNTNVGLMGETFKYVAPVAGALGYSVEDTAVAIGLMANNGIKGSQAGTALRSTITRLAKPVGEAEKAVNDLGISITNADGTMKPLSQTMLELREKFAGLTEEQKAQYAAMLAGQEGMSGLLAIVNSSEADFNKLAQEINNSSGAAKNMADVMMDNTKGAVEQLKGALESAGIVVGKQLTPYIRKAAEVITKLVDNFNNLSEEEQKNITKWALLVAGIPPFLMVGSRVLKLGTSLVGGFKSITAAISAYQAASALASIGMESTAGQMSKLYSMSSMLQGSYVSFAHPIGIAVTAVGALAAGMVAAEVAEQAQIEKLSELSGKEGELAKEIQNMSESYESMIEKRKENLSGISEEATTNQSLANELKSIVDENGKVTKGNETRAGIITGLLSEALGIEIEMTDGVIQNYGELQNEIDKTIEKQKALAMQEALQDDYAEAITNRVESQRKYNEALETQQKWKGKVQSIEDEIARKQNGEWKEAQEKYGIEGTYAVRHMQEELSRELEIAKGKYENASEAVEKAEDAYVGYNETVKNYEGLTKAIAENDAEGIRLAMLKVEQAFLTAGDSTVEALTEQRDNLKEQLENMKQEMADGNTQITQQMIDDMSALVDQSEIELTNGINQQKEKIVSEFGKIGIELPEELASAILSAEPEVQQTVFSMLQRLKDGTALKKEELKTLFSAMGYEAPQELITQMSNLSPQVQAQAINLLTQLQTAESSKRPEILQQLNDLGIKMDDNLISGLDSKKGEVENKGKEVGKRGNQGISKEVGVSVNAPKVKDVSNADEVGRRARAAIASHFTTDIGVKIKATIENVKTNISGSHANGLSYVPYNGYIAELHEGERVLTKQENMLYNKGIRTAGNQGGDTFNFYNTQPTPYEYARQMKKAKKELFYGI